MGKKTDLYWRCYPPFIDAYNCTDSLPDSYRYEQSLKGGLEDLKVNMKQNAHRWGEHSIGEQVMRTGEALKIDGKLVMCVGYASFTGRTGKITQVKLAMVVDRTKPGYWWDNVEFVEYDYPSEWDVT